MSNGFRTDVELLAIRAAAFGGLSESAGRIADDLRADVEQYGECWGADEVGRSFAEGHVAAAEAALTGVDTLPGALAGFGSRWTASATTFAESEHTSHAAVSGAGRHSV